MGKFALFATKNGKVSFEPELEVQKNLEAK